MKHCWEGAELTYGAACPCMVTARQADTSNICRLLLMNAKWAG